MGNCHDQPAGCSLTEVFKALDSERDYQVRRWGYRQPDNSLREEAKSVADYVVYMQEYLDETQHRVSRDPGVGTALESLRKVACLALACLEHNDRDEDGMLPTREQIFQNTARALTEFALMLPLHLNPTFNNYLLRVQRHLSDAEKYADCFNYDDAIVYIQWAFQACVECFVLFSIAGRDPGLPVLNGRDGAPA